MTNQMCANHNNRGFTLLETIIYVGLLGIMFSGIFVSIYPFFTGAERLTRNIATEGETAFVLNKIRYALAQGMTISTDTITTPSEGATTDALIIKNGNGDEVFRFEQNPQSDTCPAPVVCPTLDFSIAGGEAFPLNAERVPIENFTVVHHAPVGDAPRYLDISFYANGTFTGVSTYYLHF